MNFQLSSDFLPTGDQPEAIRQLVDGVNNGTPYQTLLGVTGSGKTFTAANVIQQVQKPTLVLSHNKTLAAQLYSEFKTFFPQNAVEYFVSYYDYFQPEAYLPVSDTYIEKDMSINDELEKLRLAATTALMSGRRDVLIVSSVSCLYGIGNPGTFADSMLYISCGQKIVRNQFLRSLINIHYTRNEIELNRGNFRVKGDTVDVFIAYADYILRIVFWGDEIEEIMTVDPFNNAILEMLDSYNIYPANIFVTSRETLSKAIYDIQDDLTEQVAVLQAEGKSYEAKRLTERVNYDLEMMRELGYCSGIENYSRYIDGRKAGTRPFCLLDYFPKDFLIMIDESHVTLPQLHAMYGGDRARKQNLVEYGFRLPSAMDNRPLKFEEFEILVSQTVYISATPGDYELKQSEGIVVEQLIRPTGLLDPSIDVRPSLNQIDDLLEEIQKRTEKDERTLVTTLTKRMAEELDAYLRRMGVRCAYIHSDVETLERVKILDDLRSGLYDVLVGVNLLREGLDLPEVSLVAILDADKEGFLRNHRSLTQTAGRAARHLEGCVIMYADRITDSMQRTIDETNRRREKQIAYNVTHNITPKTINKKLNQNVLESKAYIEPATLNITADPVLKNMSVSDLQKLIDKTKKAMQSAAKKMEFIEAAQYRDDLLKLEEMVVNRDVKHK